MLVGVVVVVAVVVAWGRGGGKGESFGMLSTRTIFPVFSV